jgi:hypothetical protein
MGALFIKHGDHAIEGIRLVEDGDVFVEEAIERCGAGLDAEVGFAFQRDHPIIFATRGSRPAFAIRESSTT